MAHPCLDEPTEKNMGLKKKKKSWDPFSYLVAGIPGALISQHQKGVGMDNYVPIALYQEASSAELQALAKTARPYIIIRLAQLTMSDPSAVPNTCTGGDAPLIRGSSSNMPLLVQPDHCSDHSPCGGNRSLFHL